MLAIFHALANSRIAAEPPMATALSYLLGPFALALAQIGLFTAAAMFVTK